MATTELPAEVRSSRWWYWIAVVPISVLVPLVLVPIAFGAVVLTMSMTAIYEPAVLFGGVSVFALVAALVIFALIDFLLTAMLPVALYMDVELIEDVVTDWQPDRDLYVIVAAMGFFVPLVSAVVALYYLYLRHEHLGIP